MNAHQHRHLDRETAEMLLSGRPAGTAEQTHPVAALLAAASAPAHSRELAGEARAVAVFRAAHLHPITGPRRTPMSVTKLLVAKAALAALGLSTGGVALAAATGHLHHGADGSSAGGRAGASANMVAAPSHASNPSVHHSASPSPSMRGLCHAYLAGAGNNPGKALDNPAFSALIKTAGGQGNVVAYCTKLLASKPGQSHTSHGNGQAHGKSADHPTGKPTSHPTGNSGQHTTGKPSNS